MNLTKNGKMLFEQCLKFGNKYERRVMITLNRNPLDNLKGLIKHTTYNEYKGLQKSGIDGKLNIVFQVKSRSPKYLYTYMVDVLFEFFKGSSEGTHQKLLRIAKESNYETIPIFLYVWTYHDEFSNDEELKEKGVWIAYTKEFCEWIEGEGYDLLEHVKPSHTITEDSREWDTRNKVLPLGKNPKKHLIKTFDSSFMPRKRSKQTTIDDWL